MRPPRLIGWRPATMRSCCTMQRAKWRWRSLRTLSRTRPTFSQTCRVRSCPERSSPWRASPRHHLCHCDRKFRLRCCERSPAPQAEVRQLAHAYGLPNGKRPDSQGICFLGKVRFEQFVAEHLGHWRGPILEEESGALLGYHDGFWFHTIGQRRGIHLSGGPWCG